MVNKNERVVRRDGEHRVVVLLRRINTAKENNNYRLNGNICGLLKNRERKTCLLAFQFFFVFELLAVCI